VNNKNGNTTTKIPCQRVRECVLEHLDNEGCEALAGAIKSHLLSCDECAVFVENSCLLNARLREELKDDTDMAPLWARISAAVDAETRAQPAASTTGMRRGRLFVYGSIAAALLIAVFTFYPLGKGNNHVPPLAVAESINDFLAFKASGRELDINSSKPVELRRWFVQRVDFEVPLNSAMPAGFRLAGGRLCAFLNRRSAAFVYHMDDKAASLYVMAETGLDTTLAHVPNSNELAVFSARGLTNLIWRSEGLLYVVVADFPEAEAIKFARSVSGTNSIYPRKTTFLKKKPLEYTKGIFAGLERMEDSKQPLNT